jgi:hypothetical protein
VDAQQRVLPGVLRFRGSVIRRQSLRLQSGGPQGFQGFLPECPFEQGKDTSLLAREVFAGRGKGLSKETSGLFETGGSSRGCKARVDLLMIFVQPIEVPAVFQRMIEGDVSQIGFSLRVSLQQSLDEVGQQPDLGDGAEVRQQLVNLVKKNREYPVFGNQRVRDRDHIWQSCG